MFKGASWVMPGVVLVCGLPAAGAATTQEFIQQAFSDLLGRQPTQTELSDYETFLGTSTRQQAALQIETATPEFHARVVNGLYSLLLQRSATGFEQNNLAQELGGGQTIEQVEAAIAGTSEYFTNRAGDSIDGFVTAIFSDLLNRAPAPNERVSFDTQLSGSTTTAQAAAEILGGTEYQGDLVAQYAQTYLHGPLSGADAAYYLGELQSSVRDEVVISQIIGSDQYFANLPEPAALPLVLAAGLLCLRRAHCRGTGRRPPL